MRAVSRRRLFCILLLSSFAIISLTAIFVQAFTEGKIFVLGMPSKGSFIRISDNIYISSVYIIFLMFCAVSSIYVAALTIRELWRNR